MISIMKGLVVVSTMIATINSPIIETESTTDIINKMEEEKTKVKLTKIQEKQDNIDLEKTKKARILEENIIQFNNDIQYLSELTGLNVVNYQTRKISLSYYGDTAEQNGGYAGITCTGSKLQEGMVASNVYPLGTKIEIEGKVYTVSDRGGSHFNSLNRLDVFVARYEGENDKEYINRLYDYGRKTVEAKILDIQE